MNLPPLLDWRGLITSQQNLIYVSDDVETYLC